MRSRCLVTIFLNAQRMPLRLLARVAIAAAAFSFDFSASPLRSFLKRLKTHLLNMFSISKPSSIVALHFLTNCRKAFLSVFSRRMSCCSRSPSCSVRRYASAAFCLSASSSSICLSTPSPICTRSRFITKLRLLEFFLAQKPGVAPPPGGVSVGESAMRLSSDMQ